MLREQDLDTKYLRLVVNKINVCRLYKPKFGQGHPISSSEFEVLYGSDMFYSWFGLNNPLIYAAHKAAGGITSLYRQIGIGCEQLFRHMLMDHFALTVDQATWSYVIPRPNRKPQRLSLDGRIEIADISSEEQRQRFRYWIDEAATKVNMKPAMAKALNGAVFEVRQGYKSKDSKRQNADIGNAGTAYTQGYLPVVVVLSNQIDSDIVYRYENAGWLVLRGTISESSVISTFAFCSQIIGYDLAGFFARHSSELVKTVDEVAKVLLSPADTRLTGNVNFDTDLIVEDELELAEDIEPNDDNEI